MSRGDAKGVVMDGPGVRRIQRVREGLFVVGGMGRGGSKVANAMDRSTESATGRPSRGLGLNPEETSPGELSTDRRIGFTLPKRLPGRGDRFRLASLQASRRA